MLREKSTTEGGDNKAGMVPFYMEKGSLRIPPIIRGSRERRQKTTTLGALRKSL